MKLSWQKIFWIFLIGSIFGAYWEESLFVVRHLIRYNTFMWEPRRGVFWGPLSPIYGLGAVVMCLVLINKKDNLLMTFVKAFFLGGIVEYVISFLQEVFLHTTSWDYSNKFLNINGRTTIPYMLFWGLLGILFVKVIYPAFIKLLEMIPAKVTEQLTGILCAILLIDVTISWTALLRQTLRRYNVPQYTIIDKVYDKYFDDEYINKKFPNMVTSDIN